MHRRGWMMKRRPRWSPAYPLAAVMASQCTGGPRYAGEQDNDPTTTTDCTTGSPFAAQVRVAEFQAFSH